MSLVDLSAVLPEHLTAAAFVLTLLAVQLLQYKIIFKPAAPDVQAARTVEVAMPEDLRRFFNPGAA